MNFGIANRWRALAAACVMALVAACGGGVETGGTGPTGSAHVEGPITGFGSIIVGGVRFDERNASVTDADDRAFDRSQLRLGMVVEVQSDRPMDDGSGGRTATATRVRLGGSLLGPLQEVGLTGARIVVLGQVVRLTQATVFEGVSGGVGGLVVGDVLEVHGFPSPEFMVSDLVATRVERRSSTPASFRVRGLARDVSTATSPPTLRIGTAVFDLSASGVPAGLGDGNLVRLVVDPVPSAGRWRATAAALESRRLDDRDEAEIEGLITTLATQRSFTVNGVAVDASNATLPAGALAPGLRVEVEGRAVNGVLVASKVELRSDDDLFDEGIDLRGRLSGLDTVAKTFVLRGVTILYGTAPPPQYDPSGSGEGNLRNDACVRVRAQLASDRVRMVATRIEFRDSCDP